MPSSWRVAQCSMSRDGSGLRPVIAKKATERARIAIPDGSFVAVQSRPRFHHRSSRGPLPWARTQQACHAVPGTLPKSQFACADTCRSPNFLMHTNRLFGVARPASINSAFRASGSSLECPCTTNTSCPSRAASRRDNRDARLIGWSSVPIVRSGRLDQRLPRP